MQESDDSFTQLEYICCGFGRGLGDGGVISIKSDLTKIMKMSHSW